jgi:RNA polymerase sporulation-specific sigma factor
MRIDREVRQVLAAQEGDEAAFSALSKTYRPLVRAKANNYYLPSGEREDLLQEGMIGLMKAVRGYDPSKGVTFHSFAELCVTRQIITAVKADTRKKHGPLNRSIPLTRPVSGNHGSSLELLEILTDCMSQTPEDICIEKAETDRIRACLAKSLSPLEASSFRLFYNGRCYADIALALGVNTKAVDNALTRVKEKARRAAALAN